MDKIFITAASNVTEADLAAARAGARFGRLDLQSRLARLAVESLGIDFGALTPRRIGICLAARSGSLATDLDYWNGRNAVGGPSPTLFAYTLPSAALGEIAIRFHLTGPNLCFVGEEALALSEAAGLLRRGEADDCVCVCCEVVTPELAKLLGVAPAARAGALLLQRGGHGGLELPELPDFPRDMKGLAALFCAGKFAHRFGQDDTTNALGGRAADLSRAAPRPPLGAQ